MKKTPQKLMLKIQFALAFIVFLFVAGCQNNSNNGDEGDGSFFQIEDQKYKVELVYDSTNFLENPVYNDFLNCEVYFSDDDKKIWKLHVYTHLGSMHGYKLYDKKGCKQYTGARFYVEMNPLVIDSIQVNRIEELKLLEPEKYLKRKLVTLVPENNIGKMIYEANAGDSIVLKSGIYKIENGLSVIADYVTLTGEPGCFIYANIDYNVMDIDAHFVKLKNLYLSHLNSENAGCSADVIMINSFSSSNVIIENCDINGCGVVGINLYGTEQNENFNYLFKNNFIHNNSQAAIVIDGTNFDEETSKYDGIVFENNKIWNNGSEKVNEPFNFKTIFTFGMDDSLRSFTNKLCADAKVNHFDKVEDKLLPFYGYDNQIIGYINPTDFSNGKQKGVLVYERFKPIKFYDKLPKNICDSTGGSKSQRMVIICSDPKTEEEYYESGGEDWAWFTNDVSEHFSKQGMTIKHILEFDEATIKRYFPGYKKGDQIGFGYIFVDGAEFEHYGHDMSEAVIQAGEAFFKKQLLKK